VGFSLLSSFFVRFNALECSLNVLILLHRLYFMVLIMGVVPKVGMKVRVLSPDKSEDWGVGEVIKVTQLFLELDDGTKLLLSDTYPIIRLEDGRVIGGLDCWWYPLEWESHAPQIKDMV
jgi:hypothetical protein